MVSKRDEATAAENELKAREKDLETVKASMQSVNYEEGQMEALQKVFMNLNRKHYFGIKATN